MNEIATPPGAAGSAPMQGDLWQVPAPAITSNCRKAIFARYMRAYSAGQNSRSHNQFWMLAAVPVLPRKCSHSQLPTLPA